MSSVDAAVGSSLKHLRGMCDQLDALAEAGSVNGGAAAETGAAGEGRVEELRALRSSVEDLCFDFTLPGYPDVELCPGGEHVEVTHKNLRL